MTALENVTAITTVATILSDIARRGARGTTTEEASYRLSVAVSSYTGRRTELHQRGVIERLAEKRDGQHVYVMPDFVNGRETAPYVPHRPGPGIEVESAVDQLEHWLEMDDGGRPDLNALRTLIDYVKGDL